MKAHSAFALLLALSAYASPVTDFSKDDEVEAMDLATRAAAAPNAATMKLIEDTEGFRGNFYTINGHKTIGFGHDCVANKDCDQIKTPMTRQQGEQLLQKEVVQFTQCVCKLPAAKQLNANQFGSLVSFAYNSGCGGLHKYFGSATDGKSVCSKLPTTNTLGGQLTSRRQKEAGLCNMPTQQMSGCDGSNSTAPTAGGAGAGGAGAGGAGAGGAGGKQQGGKGGKGAGGNPLGGLLGGLGKGGGKGAGGGGSGGGGSGTGGNAAQNTPAPQMLRPRPRGRTPRWA